MRIVFVGVGALGSYFGGALAAAGHEDGGDARCGGQEKRKRDGKRKRSSDYLPRLRN